MKRRPSTRNANEVFARARVSTTEQAERDLSLPAQLEAIRRYARERELTIAGEYVERGVTGTDDNRPQFQRMLGAIMKPGSTVGAVVVIHTSRFMRDALKARLHKESLRRIGVRVVAVQQELSDDPTGRFTEGVMELIDHLESETNGVRVRAAMGENARRGFFNGSRPPFGFRIDKRPGPRGESKNHLVVDAAEAETVRELFRLYVGGRGAKSVGADLNQRGLLQRRTLWHRDLVLKVIADEAAVGRYFWGRRDSRRKVERPREDWVPMAVPRLVDDELFELAQRVRAQRDPGKVVGRLSSSPLLLAGLLRCAQCGDSCQLETATGKRGTTYRYYNCRTFSRSGRSACPGHRISVDVLDRAVLTHAAEQLFTAERRREILRDFVEAQGVLRQKTTEQRRVLERERDEIQRRLERWYELIESGRAGEADAVQRLRELHAKLGEVEGLLEKVKPLHALPPYLYRPETIERFQERLRSAFLSGDSGVARVYLRQLIDRIVVGPDTITIEARADAAVALMAIPGGAIAQHESTDAGVLAHVVDWHANWVPRMNVRSAVAIDLPQERKGCDSKPLSTPLVSRLLAKAEQWQSEIDRGEVRNRAQLARREGLSQVYVGHLLGLLRLHPRIRAAIAALPPGTPPRLLTERRLRPLLKLPWEAQLAQLRWLSRVA